MRYSESLMLNIHINSEHLTFRKRVKKELRKDLCSKLFLWFGNDRWSLYLIGSVSTMDPWVKNEKITSDIDLVLFYESYPHRLVAIKKFISKLSRYYGSKYSEIWRNSHVGIRLRPYEDFDSFLTLMYSRGYDFLEDSLLLGGRPIYPDFNKTHYIRKSSAPLFLKNNIVETTWKIFFTRSYSSDIRKFLDEIYNLGLIYHKLSYFDKRSRTRSVNLIKSSKTIWPATPKEKASPDALVLENLKMLDNMMERLNPRPDHKSSNFYETHKMNFHFLSKKKYPLNMLFKFFCYVVKMFEFGIIDNKDEFITLAHELNLDFEENNRSRMLEYLLRFRTCLNRYFIRDRGYKLILNYDRHLE